MARSLPFLIRHAFVFLLAAVVGTHAIATNSGRKSIDDILDGHMDLSYKNDPFAVVASANIKAERINNASRSNVTSPAADMIRSKLHLFKTATRFEKELNNTSQMHPTWRDNGIEKIKYTYGVKAIKNFMRRLRRRTNNKYLEEISSSHHSVKVDPTEEEIDRHHEDFINKERKATIFPHRTGYMEHEHSLRKFLRKHISDTGTVNNIGVGVHGN